jgi:uncharacterized protein YoxC
MTWEIVVGIISLVTFFISVGAVVYKLSRALAVLETTIRALSDTIRELRTNSHDTHKQLFDRVEDHETRITVLEKTKK